MRKGSSGRRWLCCLVGAALALGAVAPVKAQGESVVQRIATLAPRGSTWMRILERGAVEIDQRTEGRVRYKYYDSGTQGDERDVVRKMRLGQLDGAVLTAMGLSLIDQSVRVLELPRMFASVEELDYVRSKMWPYFQRKFAQKGFVLTSEGDVGWIYFYSRPPVRSIEDLRRLKVWLWTDDHMVKAIYAKLGVSGVPLGVPDVLPALTSGRVDAAYNSPLGAMALQWNGKVQHMASMPMSYAIGATVMRKQAWDAMSASDRAVVQRVEALQAQKLRQVIRRDNDTAQRVMTRKGVRMIDTPAATERVFDEAARAVWRELAGTLYSQEELDMVLRYRNEYRARGK